MISNRSLPARRGWTTGRGLLALTTWIALAAPLVHAAEEKSLAAQLEPLRPLLGKTFRGELKGSTPEKPVVDVSRWERAVNGQAVRVLHSINQGAYGGETLIYWDASKKSLAYLYVTTAGFQTSGTMTIADGRITSHEKVTGASEGITEVKATSELRPDGTLVKKADGLKDGKWEELHSAVYREDPKAEVVFK